MKFSCEFAGREQLSCTEIAKQCQVVFIATQCSENVCYSSGFGGIEQLSCTEIAKQYLFVFIATQSSEICASLVDLKEESSSVALK